MTNRVQTRIKCRTARKPVRKGAVAVLTAVLGVPLLGMVAFAVDVAWIASAKSRLQAAADAAAMAGARQLMTGYVTYHSPLASSLPTIISSSEASATTYAKNFASYNSAGNVNSLTLADADIEFGYTTSAGAYTKLTGTTTFPNTFKVTLRLDGSNNTALGLFFAPVLGMTTTTVTASATTVIYTGSSITSFNTSLNVNGVLLPVTMDVSAWTNFYATGQSPDGVVHLGSNGLPQLQIYPSPGNAPGNFGLLSVGAPSSSDPTYSSWVDNGPSSTDLQYLDSHSQVPASTSSPATWSGGPGLKSNLRSDFAGIMGQSRLVPVFQPVSLSPYQAAGGNGNNTTYSIVGFVGVTISQADGSGNNMTISVQPAATIDPTASYTTSSTVPAGEGSASVTTMLPRLVN
jgi:Flp pilus assembly protein TadG